MVTVTAPGFGVIEPDNVTEDPAGIVDCDVARVIPVDGLVKVVNVTDVLVLVDV